MSKLTDNRTYISIIVTLLFILVGGLLFAGTPVYAAPLTQDVLVTLTANPTTVNESEIGADIVYTLSIENQHSATIRILDLYDSIGTLQGVGSCPVTTPPAEVLVGFGQTFECTFTRNLPLAPGTFNNIATAEVSAGGTVATNIESDDVDVTVQDTLPSFTVTKTADRDLVGIDAPPPFDRVTFTIDIQNNNTGESVSITALDDSVYGDVTTLPAPGGSTCVLPQLLAPSGTYSCTYTIPAQTGNPAFLNPPYMNPAYVPGTIRTVTSLMQVTGSDDEANSRDFSSSNVSVRFTDQEADLGVAVADERGARGENVTFTVILTNNGPDPATNASVEITNIDPNLTYVSAAATSGSYNSGTGIWSGISATSGSTAELELTFRIDVPFDPVAPSGPQPADTLSPAFDATVNPLDQYDANTANDTDDPDLEVVIGVQISKDSILIDNDISGTPTVGDGISWVICVENMDAVSQAPDSTVPTDGIVVNDSLGPGQSVTLMRRSIASTCPTTIGDLAALTWTSVGTFPVNIGKLAANGSPGDVGVVNIETTLNSEGFTLSSLMPVEIVQPDNSTTNANDNFVKPDAKPPASTAATIQVEPEPFPLALVISAAIIVLAFVFLTIFNLRNLPVTIRPQPVAWARVVAMVAILALAVLNFTQPSGAFAQEETPETPTDTVEPTDEPTETETATEETTTPEPSDTPEDDETETPEAGETDTPEGSDTPETSETPEETETPEGSETPEETETPEPSETEETPEVTEETETPEPSETEETPEVTEEPSVVPTLSDQLNTPTPTVEAAETPTVTPTGQETIGGVIWVDVDEDGAVSGEDAPAVNVLVALYMDDGDQVFDVASDTSMGETSTDAEGAYRFDRLEEGEYWVVVDTGTLPEEAVPGQQLAPQAIAASGVVNFLLVAQTDLNTDFSQGPGRITGMAFNDNNGNRLWDGDVESGLRYVDVALYFDTGDNAFDQATDQEVARMTTDWDGIYTFDQLGEGRYWVWLDESTLPEHYMDTVAYGKHGIQNPQEVVLSDLPQGVFANARIDVEGPYFAYTLDTDGDGSPDGVEGAGDRDSDGIPNYLDTYDPSGTVFGWDGTNGNVASGVTIGLYVDEGNGLYDGTEPLADVIQANPQTTGADGAYRFDILVGTTNGIPTGGATETFLLAIDEGSLPEQYSFGLTPVSGVSPPWAPNPTLDVPAGPGTYQVSTEPYPTNGPAPGEPYHIAFIIAEDDQEVVNNHIPLNVADFEGGWVNEACAYRSTASTAYQVCHQWPVTNGVILDVTLEPNQSSTIGVTTTQSYCHTLTNQSTNDEQFTIRFPAGSQGWTQSLVISTGDCISFGGTAVQTIGQGSSYTTDPIASGGDLYLEHFITPPIGTPNNEIDVTAITAESVTDSRLTRTVTDITTSLSGTIEGVVFDDNNHNGIQDVGEPGIPGVGVYLYDFLFSIANVTTNANGEYTFDGVPPGALYVVELDPDTLNNPVYINPTDSYSNFLNVFAGVTTVQDFAVDVSSTTPVSDPNLTISVSPTSVAAGGSATYTITLTKNSTTPGLDNVVVVVETIDSDLTVGTPTTTQGSYSVAQGTHGVYLKGAALQTSPYVIFTLNTVNPGTTVTMTIPVTASSSATAQTIYETAYLDYARGGVQQTRITSSQATLTITTTSAQATATADAANANATSTASAASSSGSSGSSSASTSADTLPLTGYVSHPAAGISPAQVLVNILTGIITTLLVIAGLVIGTWGLLLYFERLPQSFIDRFDWLRSDRTWYSGSIAFTIVMTLFIVLQVIAPPANVPQVAEVPAEAAEAQVPVDVVAVSAANERGEQPAAAPNAARHIKPPDPARRLLIPKLEIDTSVVDAQAIGNTWDVTTFKDEAAHLEGTAHLGTLGNAVIAGHVRTEEGLGVFRNVKQLDVGDEIIAQGDNVEYVYEVLWVEEVDPSEMGVVAPSDEAILTLITCTDWDSGQWTYLSRMIVRAKLVEVRPIE